jgi:membrane fusion protein, multidrug efflux system
MKTQPLPPASLPWWKHPRALRMSLVTLTVGAAGLALWLVFFFPYVSTDDARVAATLVRLAPQGSGGLVVRVAVDAGDPVHKGQVLVELDHREAQAELERAQARNAMAQRDWERAQRMAAQKAISARTLQQASTAARESAAELQLARLALDDTYLTSPLDGVVLQRTVEVGDILERAQTALTLADLAHAWVAANVEETGINRVRVGQAARLSLDSGGDLTGRVSEITSASESQFSLIPMENPSGNFIKLVQRIPLKIVLDPHPDVPLKVGQSVEVHIRVH